MVPAPAQSAPIIGNVPYDRQTGNPSTDGGSLRLAAAREGSTASGRKVAGRRDPPANLPSTPCTRACRFVSQRSDVSARSPWTGRGLYDAHSPTHQKNMSRADHELLPLCEGEIANAERWPGRGKLRWGASHKRTETIENPLTRKPWPSGQSPLDTGHGGGRPRPY
jgi:hypothetical protein